MTVPDLVTRLDTVVRRLPNGHGVRVLSLWTYLADDPLVISLHLHHTIDGVQEWVIWELSRDVLMVACHPDNWRPAGGGDVWMYTSLDNPGELHLLLCTRDGPHLLACAVQPIRDLLDEAALLVEPHGQDELARVDRALAEMGVVG